MTNFAVTTNCIMRLCRQIGSQIVAAVCEESVFLPRARHQRRYRSSEVISSRWSRRTRIVSYSEGWHML